MRFLAAAAVLLASGSCLADLSGRPDLITVYAPEVGVSLPLPRGWSSATSRQGGYRMATFTGPSVDIPERDGIQIQVMAGPLATGQSLREVADQFYMGEHSVLSEAPWSAGGHEGAVWTFEWERRPQSGRLLLADVAGTLYGVYTTGEARSVLAYGSILDTIYEDFAVESLEFFDAWADDDFGLVVPYPESWTRSHVLKQGAESLVVGFRSGPLAVDANGASVHATLDVTVRRALPDSSLEAFYAAEVETLGDSYRMLRHDVLDDGGIAVLYAVETQHADFLEWVIYKAAGGYTYLFRFHCQNTLYRGVEPWFMEIASGFAIG